MTKVKAKFQKSKMNIQHICRSHDRENKARNTYARFYHIVIHYYIFIICFLLLIFSLLPRLYHIGQYTEFLGDQGSAGVVIMEHFQNNTIPLVGPMVSTGQRPGPAYYYLVASWWILSGFNPVAPAIGMAFYSSITVALLFLLLKKLSNLPTSFLLSILYSLSPLLFDRSRNAWNPTTIPLFVTLSLLVILIIREKIKDFSPRFSLDLKNTLSIVIVLLGYLNGVVIQLHYGSMIFLMFSLFMICGLGYRYGEHKIRRAFHFGLLFLVGVGIAELPFLIYQFQHGFEDFRSLLLLFLSPEYIKEITKLPVDRPSFLDLSSRLLFNAIYMPEPIIRIIAHILVLGIPLIVGILFEKLLVIFYILSIVFLHYYNGPVPDHYMNFLIPFPFIFLVIILRKISEKYHGISISIALILIGLQVYRYMLIPPLVEKRMDIPRTDWFTDEMIKQSNGNKFSFTPVLSRSFSDYHYRFFFAKKNVSPEPIEKGIYNTLFLTCEKEKCPTWNEIKDKKFIYVLCFDHICGPNYPKIEVNGWNIIQLQDNPYGGKLYTLMKS